MTMVRLRHRKNSYRSRGATLIEVLVVSTIFSALLTVILMIYFSTMRAQRLFDVKSDIDRTVLAAVRHLDASLKSSRLISPDDWDAPKETTFIELKALKRDATGEAVITPGGFPQWEDPYLIAFDQGELVRLKAAGFTEDADPATFFFSPGPPGSSAPERRVFAKLGKQGEVTFLRPSLQMLTMNITVEREGERDYKSSRHSSYEFRLFNQ